MFKTYLQFLNESKIIYDLTKKLPSNGSMVELKLYQAESLKSELVNLGYEFTDGKKLFNVWNSIEKSKKSKSKMCWFQYENDNEDDIKVGWRNHAISDNALDEIEFNDYFKLKPESRGYNMKKYGV